MICAIRVVAVAGTITHYGGFEPGGTWVKSYDPDAFDGRGDVTLTSRLAEARRFPHAAAALDYYRQVSGRRRYREDGQLNRPLTAFTVQIEPVP